MRLEPGVHVGHFLHADVKRTGNVSDHILRHFAVVGQIQPVFNLAQIEKQLFLRGGGADFDQRPGIEHIFLHRRPDPPQGIGGKTKPFVGIKLVHRIKQPDVAFGNHFRHRQPVTAELGNHLHHQPEVRGNQPIGYFGVAGSDIFFGQVIFLLLAQNRKLFDILQITRKVYFRRKVQSVKRNLIFHHILLKNKNFPDDIPRSGRSFRFKAGFYFGEAPKFSKQVSKSRCRSAGKSTENCKNSPLRG